MRTLQIIFFAGILLGSIKSLAQPPKLIPIGVVNDTNWMPKHDADILKSMKLVYKKPAIFNEVKGMECFKDNPQMKEILTCVGRQLHSNDGQFIAFISIFKPFDKQDSIGLKKIMPGGNFDHINKQHTNKIRGDIRGSLGKEASLDWKRYVTYYTPEQAKAKFNADSAVFVPIKFISPKYYYKGKYNNLESLYLQKKGRGFINFYCFYTDKAKKNLSQYRKAIEGIFRYED